MKYLKLFVDFVAKTESYTDAEVGRLVRAMLSYANTNENPKLKGNEKYIWDAMRVEIDSQRASYEEICRRNRINGSRASGGQWAPVGAGGGQWAQEQDKDKEKDNFINTLPSFVHSSGEDPAADADLERLIDRLQLHLYQGTEKTFARSVENTIKLMWYSNTIKVNGRRIGQGAARSVLKELTIDHVDFILSRIRNMGDRVTNGQAYLISCIYNAPADFAVNTEREAN